MRVLGVAGSLRAGSYNRSLLRCIADVMPDQMHLTVFDLADIPMFNADVEQVGDPSAVLAWKSAIADADALLFATPEYQHGIPGVLKNALDWASRPAGSSALQGKPAAIVGATPGVTGTARAQEQLRQVLAFSNVFVVPSPEVLIGRAHDKFDATGRFTDQSAVPFIQTLLQNLHALTLALQSGHLQ